MKQLSILNIARLRTEESFGYQKQVVAETANLPIGEETGTPSEISQLSATNPVLEAKVNDFTTAVDAFDDALKASSTNPATATATATDDARDASWRGANNYVTAMCAHPTAEVAANAADVPPCLPVESEECLSALDTHMLHNGTSMLVTDYLYTDVGYGNDYSLFCSNQ